MARRAGLRRGVGAVAAGVGAALAALLVRESAALAAGLGGAACGPGGACAAALASPWAVVPPRIGPLAGAPAVSAAVVGVACLAAVAVRLALAPADRAVRIAVATGGVASVGWLVAMALAVRGACPLCLGVHAANAVVVLAVLGPRGSAPAPRRATAAWGAALVAGALAAFASARGGVGAELARAGGLDAWLEARWAATEALEVDRHAAARAPYDAVDGPEGAAAAELLLFTDPECPACRRFERELEATVRPAFEGELRVVWKPFPLTALHPHAEAAARALDAARAQGGHAALREALLEVDDLGRTDWAALARAAGLDVQRFERDRADPAAAERVAESVLAGRALGVDATPTAFLDRRRVPAGALWRAAFWRARAAEALGRD